MASPLRTVRFMAVRNTTLAVVTPIPVGFRGVVVDVDFYYGGVSVSLPSVSINGVTFFAWKMGLTQSIWAGWTGRKVIEAGEPLEVVAQGDGIDCTITGWQLTLP